MHSIYGNATESWMMKIENNRNLFFFYASSLRFLSDESPKQSDQNKVMESNQHFFRGSHQFWMMSDEFWIISSKQHLTIRTSPIKCSQSQVNDVLNFFVWVGVKEIISPIIWKSLQSSSNMSYH